MSAIALDSARFFPTGTRRVPARGLTGTHVSDGPPVTAKSLTFTWRGRLPVIAQHRVPDETNEITQVRELLDPVGPARTVITAEAAHAQHDTAEYIAGERGADYLPMVKGNRPALQRAVFDKVNADCGTEPDHAASRHPHKLSRPEVYRIPSRPANAAVRARRPSPASWRLRCTASGL